MFIMLKGKMLTGAAKGKRFWHFFRFEAVSVITIVSKSIQIVNNLDRKDFGILTLFLKFGIIKNTYFSLAYRTGLFPLSTPRGLLCPQTQVNTGIELQKNLFQSSRFLTKHQGWSVGLLFLSLEAVFKVLHLVRRVQTCLR